MGDAGGGACFANGRELARCVVQHDKLHRVTERRIGGCASGRERRRVGGGRGERNTHRHSTAPRSPPPLPQAATGQSSRWVRARAGARGQRGSQTGSAKPAFRERTFIHLSVCVRSVGAAPGRTLCSGGCTTATEDARRAAAEGRAEASAPAAATRARLRDAWRILSGRAAQAFTAVCRWPRAAGGARPPRPSRCMRPHARARPAARGNKTGPTRLGT